MILTVFLYALGEVGFHGKRPTRDAKGRSSSKVVAEDVRLQSRRCDNQLQIPSSSNHLSKHTKQNIRVKAALVGFVHDDGGILVQIRVVKTFAQENTVRWNRVNEDSYVSENGKNESGASRFIVTYS